MSTISQWLKLGNNYQIVFLFYQKYFTERIFIVRIIRNWEINFWTLDGWKMYYNKLSVQEWKWTFCCEDCRLANICISFFVKTMINDEEEHKDECTNNSLLLMATQTSGLRDFYGVHRWSYRRKMSFHKFHSWSMKIALKNRSNHLSFVKHWAVCLF